MYPAHSPCYSRLTSAWSKDGAEFYLMELHAAHPHLHFTPIWRHLDLTALTDGWWLMNPDDPCMDRSEGKPVWCLLRQVRWTWAVSRRPPRSFPLDMCNGAPKSREENISLLGIARDCKGNSTARPPESVREVSKGGDPLGRLASY